MKICFPLQLPVYFMLIPLLFSINGCALFEIDKEVAEFDESFGLIGQVEGRSSQNASVVVALYQKKNGEIVTSQYLIADNTNHYSFIVREGTYCLSAFEDANNNFIYDPGERFGFYGKPDYVTVNEGSMESAESKAIRTLNIELAEISEYPDAFPRRITDGSLAVDSYKKIGLVKSLDDPIFKQENGSLGYWKPVSFLKTIGFGIYFLEEFDPDKIPVLFVHGANGTPVGWKAIVEQLDQKRFQPWFYFYPSGGRLNDIAGGLNRLIKELHRQYEFRTMYVIAHSMGGLVSRSFIIKNLIEDRQDYIKKFVSISTPWGGINSAALGVEKAPGVIPSWYDVAPESAFLQEIYSRSLADRVDFHLFFGVKGKCSMMMDNNDGTVEIASEIDYRAQYEAATLHAFDEDHMSILTSDRVISRLKQILN